MYETFSSTNIFYENTEEVLWYFIMDENSTNNISVCGSMTLNTHNKNFAFHLYEAITKILKNSGNALTIYFT